MNKPGILVFSILAIMYGTLLPIYSSETEKKGKCIEGNCQDGVGKYDYADGMIYEGGWVNGLRSGPGKLIIKSKDYEMIFGGIFVENILSNDISYTLRFNSKERKYEGGFKDGQENDLGTMTYEDGSIYSGAWVDGVCQGPGKFIFPDGRLYIGDFKNNKFDGEGIFKFSENEKYEGEFREGVSHGQGTYYYPDGSKYVGSWKNDKEEGEGTLYDSDGNISQQGKWIKGLFANPLNMIIKDSEDIYEDAYYIYTLDVFNYFSLLDKYDTELKRVTYKKTNEYQSQLNELKTKKKEMNNCWFYSKIEKPFAKGEWEGKQSEKDYDVEKKGFFVSNTNSDLYLRKTASDNTDYTTRIGLKFIPLKSSVDLMSGYDSNYSENSFFLPMTYKQGLIIENNREKCDIHFLFRISSSNTKEIVLNASPVRVIVAHEDSGEVYYDKTFTSDK